MQYKLINNLTDSHNHSSRLKELFADSNKVILASPFLMTDFADFLGEVNLLKLQELHLITTLCPKSFDQIKKISSLVSLIEFPDIQNKKVNCHISLNNKLHGKVYIFKKEGEEKVAIITSANFTDSGLSRNHEWGVEISDKEIIAELEQSILGSIEFPNLTSAEIYKMQQAAIDFLSEQPQTEIREIDLKLTNLLSTKISTQFEETTNFWFKPIGVSHDPVPEDRLFNTIEDELHFSKQRPNGVKPNDILIAYGVGTTKMLSVYKVTSYPTRISAEEIDEKNEDWMKRWPWYVEAVNLTPAFGTTWAKHNLFKNVLLEQYLSSYPDKPITAVGGQTLGALNFGKDKLKLAPGFAKFIIDKIVAINDNQNL